MKHFMMECPNGEYWNNTDLNALYHAMITDYKNFWYTDNSETIMCYYQGEASWSRRCFSTIFAKANYADDEMIFLQYFNMTNGRTLYSLYDESILSVSKMIFNGDEYSAGLFLPKELAWLAVKDFLETGKPSDKIRWIALEELEKIEGASY
ncbi:MAG: hypothetical protein IKI37_05535 [Oscillospiraceae bacterium]|nr:hypothetical protein [Oscillospiraceae bacterium]